MEAIGTGGGVFFFFCLPFSLAFFVGFGTGVVVSLEGARAGSFCPLFSFSFAY
jgi:hypothetical protein